MVELFEIISRISNIDDLQISDETDLITDFRYDSLNMGVDIFCW